MPSDNIKEKQLRETQHYLEMGRFEQARTLVGQMLVGEPNNPYLLYLMAVALRGLDQDQKALDFCANALANGFSPEEGSLLMGQIHLALQHPAQAEECFLTALRLNPVNAEALATYGYLMLQTGHDQKAARLLDEALRLDPDDELVLHYNFYRFLAKNQRQDQLQVLERYMETAGSDVGKWVKSGMLELFQGNYTAAKEDFRQAFLLDPTNTDLLAMLEETARNSHPLFLPQRLIRKMGGPAVLWLVTVPVVGLLAWLKATIPALMFAGLYLGLVAYTWITPLLYHIFVLRGVGHGRR